MKTLRQIFAEKFRKGRIGHATTTGFDFELDAPLIRSRAIRAKCIECQAGQQAEVARCEMIDCPLWPWRMGRRMAKNDKTSASREAGATNEAQGD